MGNHCVLNKIHVHITLPGYLNIMFPLDVHRYTPQRQREVYVTRGCLECENCLDVEIRGQV